MIPALAGLNRAERRAMVQQLERDNRSWPEVLMPVPEASWPPARPGWLRPIAVLRSRSFMCQVFEEPGAIRLSFNRTSVDETTWRWREDISWDELQELKRQAGYGDREAVEVYPPVGSEVNVANMRHLWVLPERLPFSWGPGR